MSVGTTPLTGVDTFGNYTGPDITENNIQNLLRSGQGFSATTGKLTPAGAITGGMSVFNPNASGKTILIYSVRFMIGNNSFNQINLTTSDPALGTLITPTNMKVGSSITSVATCSSSNTTITPVGTLVDMTGAASNTQAQLLANNQIIILPSNNGICFYSNVSGANLWFVSMAWIEF